MIRLRIYDETMTYRQMCDVIADACILASKDGGHPTAEQIWNYSPTGELYMIHVWFEECMSAEFEQYGYPPMGRR